MLNWALCLIIKVSSMLARINQISGFEFFKCVFLFLILKFLKFMENIELSLKASKDMVMILVKNVQNFTRIIIMTI